MKETLLIIFLFATNYIFGQSNSEKFKNEILSDEYLVKTDIRNEFIKYDISDILTKTENSRIFGFIGDDYQRIRVKLISVIKNNDKPSQYFVYGKSMVKENVCDFQGTITVTNVFNTRNPEIPEAKQGKIIGEYLFYENPSQKHVGLFKGVFSSNWYIDKDENLKYDDLSAVADTFNNNGFVGTWTSYVGTVSKVCNWGDRRIPMAGNLDVGVGEFYPDKKYQAKGWTSYIEAYNGGNDKEKIDKARKIEQAKWWK
ncbi:hypothetical protein [Chryseolinea sp. H1M3-3]|uniref:hypothetical protein n=1 Tax=Chryseolinea sp. H1M3-3 TaxID=3034144 RepID=UPI0023EDC763|nr:hypothetical protein [Chryseolinea sp. H1M3-3]